MQQTFFNKLFAEMPLPVVVCENNEEMPVVFFNLQAGLLFAPSHSVESRKGNTEARGSLSDIIQFYNKKDYTNFCRMVLQARKVDDIQARAITFERRVIPVVLFGNSISHKTNDDYFVFYLAGPELARETGATGDARLIEVLNASLQAGDVNDAIQVVLGITGRQMDVNRTYIFEEISPTTTSNTYEWCGPGVRPAIQALKCLDKADYPYDLIIKSGMSITSDVSALPKGDAGILKAQGIKSLAIIAILDFDGPLGYVGYDDTEKKRNWSSDEIQFLKSVARLLATLIRRRKTEQSLLNSLNILQLVTDNLDDIIYANNPDTYELLFVSQSLADSLGKTEEELLGIPCYEAFGRETDGKPCAHCPIPHITMPPGSDRSDTYVWEHFNEQVGKTYLVKDNLIRWVDGRLAHVETATDISTRKEQEEKLRYYASTDVMTGIANREWGAAILEKKLLEPGTSGSLCFIDVDGLKKVNDTRGHAAGDAMLCGVVDGIKRHLCGQDFICRWGGDEFLVWMAAGVDDAKKILRAAQKDLAKESQNKVIRLAYSFGIVPFRGDAGKNLDELVTAADKRMYRDKMEKRGVQFNRRRDDKEI